MHLGSNLKIRKHMLEEWSPAMLPHGRIHSLFHPPMQLPDQACGHSCALPPLPSVWRARYRKLGSNNHTSWETLPRAWAHNLGKQGKLGKVGCLLAFQAQGEIQLIKSLGSEPPLLEHFALGEGKA